MPRSKLYGKPKQMRRTSDIIAKSLADIQNGRSSGKYPGLDLILGKKSESHASRDTVCTPECEHRQAPELIRDVRPPLTERMAVMEHMATDIKEKFEEHRTESIRAGAAYATKEELQNIDNRIDREVLSTIQAVRLDLKVLSGRKTVVTVLLTVSLIVSIIYSVLISYKNFVQ